ncbi:TonB-dependent receptor domain-containing protein [Asticcacaulis sp. AC466]|uniref:TonB-dependent receptor domain-containing protein n=1 Tax=Asticcacaulis sp. AC466 TaxID=1282362 RepID=UPI0004CF73E9|nr:TonB-dependent receptor [Asticcacaulis sp. AC466]
MKYRYGNSSLKLAASLLVIASVMPAATYAQTADPAPAADDNAVEIVVTGSRIRRDPVRQAAPITHLDQADIKRTGLTSLTDILQRLPGTTGGINSRSNSSGNNGNPPDGGGVGAGSAEVDIRYLGSRRALVLVDGQRFINGTAASGVPAAVDLNAIPESLIERVEILRDGASAVYGSDAISGVVNIITKTKQEGWAFSGQTGAYDKGDGVTELYNYSYGHTFDSTGGSLIIGGNYARQGSIFKGDRALYRFPTPGATQCDSNCSSGTPNARVIVTNPLTGESMNITLKAPVLTGKPFIDLTDPTGPNSDYKAFTVADRFNFSPYNYILTPNKRVGTFVSYVQPLGDRANFKFKATYNERSSANQAAPLPLFVGPDAGNGNLLDTISIDKTNPYNPFGFSLSAGGVGGAGANYAFIGKRLVEAGPRHFEQKVNTAYFNAGFDGNFDSFGKTWYWDVSGIYATNKATQTMSGNINAAKLAKALGPLADCTGECVPFNIFGGEGAVTKDMLNYVLFQQNDASQQSMVDFSANITGSLFELPAGPLGVAAGVEFRRLAGSFDPDPVVAAGLGSDIPALPTRGSYNVKEIYAEADVPLLKDLPGVRLLEATFAIRYFDYSTSGSDSTTKAGLSWKPVNDLRLRATWSEGFRAPSIGELYGAPSRFDGGVADPCSGFNTSGVSATIKANCITLGVPADGSYVQLNGQLPIITGGNKALKPETSESTVVGFAYSPSWAKSLPFADALSLEADYYDIKVDNSITSISADVLLNNCVTSLDATSCAAITRSATGSITQIRGILQNVGTLESAGVDLTLNYRAPQTALGRFGLIWQATFLDKYQTSLPSATGVTVLDYKGVENNGQAYPENRSNVTLTWQKGNMFGSLTGRYISELDEPNYNNTMKATTYTDIQFGWTPEKLGGKYEFAIGVNNLFGKTAPICLACGGYDAAYDLQGQFGYIRLSYKN